MESLEEEENSGFHWMGQTNIFSGMVGSCRSSPALGARRRDRASALMFLGPGR